MILDLLSKANNLNETIEEIRLTEFEWKAACWLVIVSVFQFYLV